MYAHLFLQKPNNYYLRGDIIHELCGQSVTVIDQHMIRYILIR